MMSHVLAAAVRAALIAVVSAHAAASAGAQPPAPRQERVSFPAGASSTTIKGRLKGDETIDYVVRASAGQTITVTYAPSSPSSSFNVLPPDSGDVAMYIGQGSAPYTGVLPADGDYRVRVFLVRAAARRGTASTFALTIGVTGQALAPLPAAQDALVPGTPFHAQGPITCVANPYGDGKPASCEAGVIRRGTDGTATVEVALGAAGKRRILFIKGKPTATDASEPMSVSRKGDVTTVSFPSGERHDIPDAFIFGG